MTKDPRTMLNELMTGMNDVGKTNPQAMKGFMDFFETAFSAGSIDFKTKELIAISLSVFSRCEYCIVRHVYYSLKAGATTEEILEAAFVACAFGGGQAVSFTTTLLKQCIDEFSKDFA